MLGPIIQGSMAQAYGWRSFWWLNTGLCALAFVFVLIGFPETKYHRVYESGVQDTAPAFTTTEKLHASSHDSKLSADAASNDDQKAIPSPTSYTQNDSHLGKGRPSRSQWKLLQPETHPFRPFALGLYLPFKLFCFPIVVFATFIVSFSSTCYLMITFVQSQAFAVPPYSFDQQFIGFMKFASLIGALIGLFTAGPLSDWVSAKLTQRDNGIREPEMRLPTMIPYVIIMLVGNFVVAFGLQNDWDWRAIVIVGFGCAGIQIAALPAIASTYAIDSYKPAAGTIFITITINKNVYGYGVSKFITPWVMQSGYVPPFMTNMCLLFLWVCCGAIFWIWGKRFRTWTAESSIHRL
ncbi:hypothetical protein MMC27_003061 [Xylographa pallens]|nr:hypothetical protein [Xylographa pallens]